MNSKVAVQTLLRVDPQFEALCKTLFGDDLDSDEVWSWLYSPGGVSKMNPTPSDVCAPTGGGRRRGRLRKVEKVNKDDSIPVTWNVEFAKVGTDEKRQVFGWASIVTKDGRPVVDRQGDWIEPEEIEKAAYSYVVKSRTGGHQHRRDGEMPFKASDMIESIVFTPEKIEKMGLPDDFPVGWWVGYQITDDNTWDLVKSGRVTGFSIHGRGRRQEV